MFGAWTIANVDSTSRPEYLGRDDGLTCTSKGEPLSD